MHIGAGLAEVGGMEFPGLAILSFRLLPPAARADYIPPAIGVHIADSQTVREAAGPGDFFARLARFTDGMAFPRLVHVFARCKPAHLSLVLFALRLGAHHQDGFAVAEQVPKLRRFVTRAVPEEVLFPVPGFALRILIPMTGIPRPADDDEVRPAIVIDIRGPAGERAAVTLSTGARAVAVIFRLTNLVHFPVGCFVPNISSQNVQFAIPVHVRNGHSLGAERFVHDGLLPTDRVFG